VDFQGRLRRFLTAFQVALALGALPLPLIATAQEEGLVGESRLMRQLPQQTRSTSALALPSPLSENTKQLALLGPVDEAAYVVGPGDEFFVAAGALTLMAPVGPDGFVLIDGVPPVNVSKMPLGDAKRAITEAASRYYKGGPIRVSLAVAKSFQVSVTGAVTTPGVYTLASGSTLSALEKIADGITQSGSYKVTIHSSRGQKTDYDLGGYYRGTTLDGNPLLSQGDIVVFHDVDQSRPTVFVRAGKSARLLELEPDDNLQTVVSRAGNFKDSVDWQSVSVYEGDKRIESVSRAQAASYKPKAGTVIEAHASKLKVFISGTVMVPGSLDYDASKSTLDYMAQAGLTTNSGPVSRAVILDSRGKSTNVDPAHYIPKPGDHIVVPRSFEARLRDYVGIMTAVGSLAVAIATFMVLTE